MLVLAQQMDGQWRMTQWLAHQKALECTCTSLNAPCRVAELGRFFAILASAGACVAPWLAFINTVAVRPTFSIWVGLSTAAATCRQITTARARTIQGSNNASETGSAQRQPGLWALFVVVLLSLGPWPRGFGAMASRSTGPSAPPWAQLVHGPAARGRRVSWVHSTAPAVFFRPGAVHGWRRAAWGWGWGWGCRRDVDGDRPGTPGAARRVGSCDGVGVGLSSFKVK